MVQLYATQDQSAILRIKQHLTCHIRFTPAILSDTGDDVKLNCDYRISSHCFAPCDPKRITKQIKLF